MSLETSALLHEELMNSRGHPTAEFPCSRCSPHSTVEEGALIERATK
jgi:hypothetical protein